MSAGPIKLERDGHLVPLVSTVDAHRVCALVPTTGRGYCGRKADKKSTTDWARVECADCDAARRADEAANHHRKKEQ